MRILHFDGWRRNFSGKPRGVYFGRDASLRSISTMVLRTVAVCSTSRAVVLRCRCISSTRTSCFVTTSRSSTTGTMVTPPSSRVSGISVITTFFGMRLTSTVFFVRVSRIGTSSSTTSVRTLTVSPSRTTLSITIRSSMTGIRRSLTVRPSAGVLGLVMVRIFRGLGEATLGRTKRAGSSVKLPARCMVRRQHGLCATLVIFVYIDINLSLTDGFRNTFGFVCGGLFNDHFIGHDSILSNHESLVMLGHADNAFAAL